MAFLHRPLVPEGRAARVLPCEGAVPCPEASRPWVLFVTILASAMAFIDGSVVTIAIPVMQRRELGAGLALQHRQRDRHHRAVDEGHRRGEDSRRQHPWPRRYRAGISPREGVGRGRHGSFGR